MDGRIRALEGQVLSIAKSAGEITEGLTTQLDELRAECLELRALVHQLEKKMVEITSLGNARVPVSEAVRSIVPVVQ